MNNNNYKNNICVYIIFKTYIKIMTFFFFGIFQSLVVSTFMVKFKVLLLSGYQGSWIYAYENSNFNELKFLKDR